MKREKRSSAKFLLPSFPAMPDSPLLCSGTSKLFEQLTGLTLDEVNVL